MTATLSHWWRRSSNCAPEYRDTASGFAYVFVKVPSFLAIFLLPTLFTAIGQATATLFVAKFSSHRRARGNIHPAGGVRLRAGL
jgi:hypothetical protein